ncbi:MAG: hypothetical protein ACI3WR_04455 [Oscillospiraceae bacterium]
MDIERARSFMYRNARPLDLARWQYLLEGGSREAVLRCLAAYQNEDGGFGHGLEPDCWNPHSSPVQTWAATELIREAGLQDAEHPLIRGILRYLASAADFDGHVWANTILSNDEYPHAPWWSHAPAQERSYNPTASLAGFILQYAEQDSGLYATAVRLAEEAYAFFKANCPLESMHTAACFVSLFESLRRRGVGGDGMDEFEGLLRKQVRHLLTPDAAAWETEYVCKPSLFIRGRDSVFYTENEAVCALECAFIDRTQGPDGTWGVTWDWDAYAEQWHVSKNWWKSDLIIKNVSFYRAMQG